MARLGGLLAFDPVRPCGTGGAFYLNVPALVDGARAIGDGWTVEVLRGNPFVVARRETPVASYENSRDMAFAAAQRGLDLLCIARVADLSIRNAVEWHVTWREDGGTAVLRVTVTKTITAKSEAIVVAYDQSGNPLPTPHIPAGEWQQSLRFFRLAQVTDDLFDAYRNLYLALESILDRLAPQKTKPAATGGMKPDEREGEWFKRALGEADKQVGIAAFAPQGTADPVAYLFDEFYVRIRTALFHAKSSRHMFLPHAETGQEAVQAGIERLGRLYLALAGRLLGLSGPASVITYEGFEYMAKQWEPQFGVHVGCDPTPSDDADFRPGGDKSLQLTAGPEPGLDAPHLKVFVGRAECAAITALDRVTAVAATLGGKTVATWDIAGGLDLAGVGRLEVQVGIRLRNVHMPKIMFGA